MKTYNLPFNSGPRILLTGNISRVLLDADTTMEVPCQVHTNMLDAIDAAAKNNFEVIAVVMSGSSAKLSSALKALRKANSNAKIILLAQMYEEPLAMKLVGPTSNGAGVADDYLICPIHFSHLASRISHPTQDTTAQDPEVSETTAPAPANYKTEMRIRQLEELATTDELTGLKNRRYIWEFSRQIIEHTKKKGGQVTLLVFDIDNFKSYNDIYGHSAGDEILKQAAVLMQRCCRQHDVVGRIGGDEFAVVFWDDPQVKLNKPDTERRSILTEHPKEVIFIARRFRAELKKAELHLLGPEGKGVLAISGGLARLREDSPTIQELFQQADKALLEAKRSGKNRIYLVGKPDSDIADIEITAHD